MKAPLGEFCLMSVCAGAVMLMMWLGIEYGLSRVGF